MTGNFRVVALMTFHVLSLAHDIDLIALTLICHVCARYSDDKQEVITS